MAVAAALCPMLASCAAAHTSPVPTASQHQTTSPSATPNATSTATAIETVRATPTPNGVVIPLSEILNPKTWPKSTVTDAQFETALRSIRSPLVAGMANLESGIHDCEKGDDSLLDPIMRRLPSCEIVAAWVLRAWNAGDANAPSAFPVFYAYMVMPSANVSDGGFAQQFKAMIDHDLASACKGYGVPTS